MCNWDTSREIFIDDIPEESKDIAVEKMDEVKIAKRDQDINVIGNTYIICNFNEQQKHMFLMNLKVLLN